MKKKKIDGKRLELKFELLVHPLFSLDLISSEINCSEQETIKEKDLPLMRTKFIKKRHINIKQAFDSLHNLCRKLH